MADRFLATRLTIAALSGFVALAACVPPTSEPVSVQGTQGADPDLVRSAAIMSRTVLEGAALGAGLGAAGTVVMGTPVAGMQITTTAGAVTGTYLGYLQQRFATEEAVLNQVRSDLDQSSAEIAATINVMRGVLAVQQADLARLRADVRSGAATQDQLNAQVTVARANLTEMQRAIDGAANRQTEFGTARSMVPTASGSQIDNELSALSGQIAQMRAIADDLADNL